MALWQFSTIAALIGVLLIYVMVLTNRIGATNALLKRIEEALVKPQSATENVRATVAGSAEDMTVATAAGRAVVSAAAERTGVAPAPLTMAPVRSVRRAPTAAPTVVSAGVPSPTAESIPTAARRPTSEPATEAGALEITDAPEVADRDRRVSFLTVRDLKVIARSGRRSSDSTVGMSPLFREAMERKRAEARLLAESGQSHEDPTSDVVTGEVSVASLVTEEPVVASAEPGEVRVAGVGSDEAVEESDEPCSLPASMQELAGSLLSVQELATATYEIRHFLESPNVAATEDVAPASPEVVAPTPGERDTGAANEYAEAAAITMAAAEHAVLAANEHAVAETQAEAIIVATDSHATADASSVISAPNVESVPEVSTPDVLTPAANDGAHSETSPATFAAIDEAHSESPPAAFASNDESALEAPAAAVAAIGESSAAPEATTAATEPHPAAAPQPIAAAQPVAAPQPVDEDLLERRRKRDAQLILSAQRRRRRTRGF